MDRSRLPKPPELLQITKGESMQPTREFAQQYRSQIASLFSVFPKESDVWKGTGGMKAYVPLEDPADFVAHKYAVADKSSQDLTAEFFTGIRDLEKHHWKANGKILRDYQRELLKWQSMSWCTGEKVPVAQLIDADFNMGKSLVGGVGMKFFRNLQYRELHEGADPVDVPMAGYMVMRAEHAFQNALGDQCIAQNPPYTFEKSHISQYYNDLTLLYGTEFTDRVRRPLWSALFAEEYASSAEAQKAVRDALGQTKKKKAGDAPQEMVDAIAAILTGNIVYVPGPGNKPVPKTPPERLGALGGDTYQGDGLFDTPPIDIYPVKASHKDLLPGRKPANEEDEGRELLYVMSSSVITGSRVRTREGVKEALQRLGHGGLLVGDEMGKFSPNQFRYPFTACEEIGAKSPPHIVGLTADDTGRPGWTRSPAVADGIKMGITPCVGYEYIGPKEKGKLVSPGTEEAWEQFLAARFVDVPLSKALGIKQPLERNTLVVVGSAKEAIEYMERYALYCGKHGIPWDVSAYCASFKRYKQAIRDWFCGPGSGKTLFAAEGDVSHALHFPTLENIETVCRIQNGGQLLGRLHHNATMLPGSGAEAARRVTFREHALLGCAPLLAKIAAEQGIELPTEEITWLASHILEDKAGFERDRKRSEVKRLLKTAVPIADTKPNRATGKVGTPLAITNAFSVAHDRKKEGRQGRVYDFVPDAEGLISHATLQQWLQNEGLSFSYTNAVRCAVRDAYQDKKRGHDLALAAYDKINTLLKKSSERDKRNGSAERGPAVYRMHS